MNQFVARVEPDEQDERIGRSLADRYVSVRPDLDGVSVLSAALSSLDAAAIDRVLTAIASVAEPGDTRTLQQRRADALVDVPLWRISNGCHTRWDGLGDNGFDEDRNADDRIDDDSVHETTRDDAQNNAVDDQPAGCDAIAEGWDTDCDQEPTPDHPDTDTPDANTGIHTFDADIEDPDRGVAAAEACAAAGSDDAGSDDAGSDDAGSAVADKEPAAPGGAPADADADLNPDVDAGPDFDGDADAEVDVDDWDLPGSAFRPDPPRGDDRPLIGPTTGAPPDSTSGSGAPSARASLHQRRPRRARGGVQIRPVQVNIGVSISAAALLGFSNTPGQLADRSALIPADTIRDLAARPGTLFHRLVTDTTGNLLEVTELGRFPSKKLALAVTYRDGVCNSDTCHVPATRGDLDHGTQSRTAGGSRKWLRGGTCASWSPSDCSMVSRSIPSAAVLRSTTVGTI